MSVKIVHLSDLHIEPEPEERFPGLMTRLATDRDRVNGLDADLVVVTGDITNFGSSRVADLLLAREWLGGLDAPFLAVAGNHDLGPVPHRGVRNPQSEAYHEGPFATSGYASVFGESPVTRAELPGLTMIGISLREDDPDGALELLEAELASASTPVILAGHYPVVPTREIDFSIEFGTDDYIPRAAARLRELIEASPKVIAYLCGHVHLTSMRVIGDHCIQLSAGGLGSGASSYRVLELESDRLSYETLDGSGPAIFWEKEFAAARAVPNFSAGEPVERSGAIDLKVASA